jgi:4-hydroxyphenylpyruvate dioxygenase-like putative hemolysin
VESRTDKCCEDDYMSEIKKGVLFSRVDQIGVVVKNVEKTAKLYEKLLKQEPLPPIEFETGNVKLKIVFFQLGEVQLELIQVLEGENIHTKFLRERGEGLHHIGFFVKDLEEELAALKNVGIEVLWRGEALEVTKFAYLDTEKTLGIVLELIQFD